MATVSYQCSLYLRHGQAFSLTIIVYDQNLNNIAAEIYSFVRSGKARLSEGQAIQRLMVVQQSVIRSSLHSQLIT